VNTLARKKIAKDPSASILPSTPENTEDADGWEQGLELGDAFEITADPKLLRELRNLPQGRNLVPPDLYKNPDFKKDEFDNYKISANKQDRLLFKRLETNFIKKLKIGSLIARGNKQGDYVDARFQISPEQWHFLTPRYRDSTAQSSQDSSESPSLIHILVFQPENIPNEEEAPPSSEHAPVISRRPGRPSERPLIEAIFKHRASKGETVATLRGEAEEIYYWARNKHLNKDIPEPKTIQAHIRKPHREWRLSKTRN
jgi:hypothetical protein